MLLMLTKGISFNAETNINIWDVIEKCYLCVSKIIIFYNIFNFETCYSQHCLQLKLRYRSAGVSWCTCLFCS